MGYIRSIYWALTYVLATISCEFIVFYFLSENSDTILISVLVISFILGGVIGYKNIHYNIVIFIFFGLAISAVFAFFFELKFYYHDYPDNFLDFFPNLIFKPIIILFPLLVSFLLVKFVSGNKKANN